MRFALMCRGPVLRAWEAQCLKEILAVPGTELTALIVDDRSGPTRGARTRMGRLALSRTRLWDAFNNGYVARRSRALAAVDLSDRLAAIPRLSVSVERRGRYSEYFVERDLERIAALDLDFALRFAFGIIRGPILDTPKLGVWSFHHGDEEHYRGGPPCFWEVRDGTTVTGAVLQRLTDRLDAGVILQKGWFRTTTHSYVRTTDDVHFGSAPWPAKVCRDLRAGVADYLQAEPSSSDAPVFRNPTDATMVRFGGALVHRTARSQARAIVWADQWNVGVVDRPIEALLDGDPLPEPRWFPRPDRSHYVADPFAASHDGTTAVLAERYDYRTRTGTIAALTIDGMSVTEPEGLPAGVHTSYPYLVDVDGSVYCLPETSGRDGVRCFRATSYPGRWQEVATLVPGVAALDPTVAHHEGRWWLFFTQRAAPLTELHLWWAANLRGPWTPHTSNPVKTDIRSARPAGTPFVVDGQLYRPAQDCSTEYGGAVAVNRVEVLTPSRYQETLVRVVDPSPGWAYSRGLHTVSALGDHLLVDAKRRVIVPRESLFELAARVRQRR